MSAAIRLGQQIATAYAVEVSLGNRDRPPGPCVRDDHELLDRLSGTYLSPSEQHAFFWHLHCCYDCRRFVAGMAGANMLSVPQ